MKKNYKKYQLNDFLHDKEFVDYVLYGINSGKMENILGMHEELRQTASDASVIIQLKADENAELDEKEVEELWLSIAEYSIQKGQSKKRIGKMHLAKSILKYAAGILLLFATSYMIYMQLGPKQPEFVFSDTSIPINSGEARILLHTGQEIPLQTSQSSVDILSDGEIFVNNQKVEKQDIVQGQGQRQRLVEARMNEIIVPYGNTSRLTLPDGTLVWLNAGTRIAFSSDFSGKERIVYLEGEAYFEVAHNPDKAFRVNAGNLSVTALGTIFNVTAYPGDDLIKSFLLEGKIAVSGSHSRSARERVIVKPNQAAIYSIENQEISINPVADAY